LLRSPSFDSTDLSSLRKGYYGASIMPVEVLREMAQRLPKVRLWNLYGQTEIAPLATMLGPEDQLRKLGSCGRAVLNLHSAGGSRSRSIPMPRGRRPSTAALTRLGARKASEMVILRSLTALKARLGLDGKIKLA
jgi:acyl-CoA synthetase (AMP-forming)/AMP-acid ligase II